MPVGLGARSATPRSPEEGIFTISRHPVFNSISMNAKSKAFALRTSCSVPAWF